MTTTRESSTETADRYTFGYTTELSSNHESSLCTAKRLRQRLQRQQSGQSGRRYTGESSECSSLVGTPTESGRCFTFTAAQRILRSEDRKPSVNQNLSEMLLDAIHLDDVNLVDRLLSAHSSNKVLSTSPSIGSTNTFTDLAQRRHGAATNQHRRSNASSTVSTHSGGRSNCAVANTLHMAVAHKQRDIVELLLKSGYDPNIVAQCHCKGNCTTSGNISLSSVLPRTHSGAPEMCSTCSHLRVVSIIDQSPLGIAVRAQSPEMIATLVAYGAEVNAVDEDGNTPLMLAVRESPLSWHSLHMLIMFGARIMQKNSRGICPLDLAPELRKLQESCVETLFHTACQPPAPHSSIIAAAAAAAAATSVVGGGGSMAASASIMEESSGGRDVQSSGGGGGTTGGNGGSSGGTAQERLMKTASIIGGKHVRKSHVDTESLLLPASFYERTSLSKAPLSPRTSTAPSVSTCSMMESLSVNKDKDMSARRKSFVSLQLNRRSKISKESPFFENIGWEQAWEMLQKMAGNQECIELIIRCLHKASASAQMEDSIFYHERDTMDSHLCGLLHQLLLTSIGEYQRSGGNSTATDTFLNAQHGSVSTPPATAASERRAHKRHLIGVLVALVNFCYLCLQKSGSCRQFAALSTLNKIIDAALVNALFVTADHSNSIQFHSSRLLNRTHEFHPSEQELFDADQCGASGCCTDESLASSFHYDPHHHHHYHNHPTIAAAVRTNHRRRETNASGWSGAGTSNAPSMILHSFYRKHGSTASASVTASGGAAAAALQTAKLGDLVKVFSTLQPSIVIACLHNAITMQNREAGARSVCSPAHRWRQCYFHCTQILAARLLLFCTSFRAFRQRLSKRSQLKTIVQLLEPTLDPQLLCLLLQAIAIIALDPSTTDLLVEIQIDDSLIQMLLPADDWYYTNHSTKFGHFVKHHAARILVYIGLGDRVGNRVNLFQLNESLSGSGSGNVTDPKKALTANGGATTSAAITSSGGVPTNASANEDDYISDTLRAPNMSQEFSRTAMSVEGVLLKVLYDLSKNANSSNTTLSAPITEETSNAMALPTAAYNKTSLISPTGCIIEECELDSPAPSPHLHVPHRPLTPQTPPPNVTPPQQTIDDSPHGTPLLKTTNPAVIAVLRVIEPPSQATTLTIPTGSGCHNSVDSGFVISSNPLEQSVDQTAIAVAASPPTTITVTHTASFSEPSPTFNELALLSADAAVANGLQGGPSTLAAAASAVVSLNLSNLENHLWKFSMVLDSMLLLRLLLHKLSWDLSLVAKRRALAAAQDSSHRGVSGSGGGGSTGSCAIGGNYIGARHTINESRAYSSCSLGNSFYNRNFGKSKSFDRREEHSIKSNDNKRFLRVDQNSRLSKRVHIRRSSSVEIPRPKRFSSGAKELRKERRKRLGTDTSSGSSKSKKTISSTSSVQKHLPKYIQSLFRGRMGTDPCKRHTRVEGDSSPDSNTSGSEAVLEFTKKLQNIPPGRRETMRQAYKTGGRQDSSGTNSENKARSMGYSYLPEVEINGASPPRSPTRGSSGTTGAATNNETDRRPSSPQAIPGLPLIEIRRPSALSQFEFGYFVNSPDIVSGPGGGGAGNGGAISDSDCAPLLLRNSGVHAPVGSRKSSDESSMCGWSSRASSAMSRRSSSGGLRLSTFSGGTSIASDTSGPFLFSFVLRKRASTIGTRIPLPKRAISRSSGDSLRVPDRESPLQLMSGTEMSPDFQCIRQLLLNLLCMYTNKNGHFVATLRWCSDVLRQVLNSPQHPTVKNWCADIMNVVNAQLEMDEDGKVESDERTNDEYLDLQDQVISGSLPCPREEAAMMAAIQICVEENWPSNRRTQTIRRHLLKGQFGRIRDLAQKIMVTPWEVDQTLYCTPPRIYGVDSAGTVAAVNMPTNNDGIPPLSARKQSLALLPSSNPSILTVGGSSTVSGLSHALATVSTSLAPPHQQQIIQQQQQQLQLQQQQRRRNRPMVFFNCLSEPDPMMSADLQALCLPMDWREDKRTIKCIREKKRKLFHSHVYESELGMKKLYIQTAKKLPAYGCKVFQVKELLHGRTLRKTMRLLCLSSSVLCLLDGGSKMVLKRQHAATLQQWRVGGGVSKHQLLLEFRGTKWQLIAPSYNILKSISITLWEIMQNRASVLVQKSFNKSTRASLALFDPHGITTAHSSRTNSYSSTSSSFRNGSFCSGEPITLFRLELERLQYILHFPEEVAFQLSSTEYQLFYSIAPIDFIRYVGCDLASIPIADNPSPVRNLVKRLSEVSSWITHVIISQPTHEDRKNCLAAIIRVIDTCWNIGNFNAAVEILMGLKSNKLRPFWLSLKHEERQRYEEFVDILLPNNEDAAPHPLYLETVQRALRMPQCRVIPFFGTFLRDLYAIVNDLPNVVVIGNSGETEKLKFLSDINGDDHYSSNIGVGGLLNTDKINLVGLIIDNLETFHNHNKQLMRYVETPPLMVENVIATSGGGNFVDLSQLPQNQSQQQQLAFSQQQQQQQNKSSNHANGTLAGGSAIVTGDSKPPPEVKPYEPVQPVAGSSHGVTLIPLNSLRFDLDMIQRLQHGTTVIHYDPDSGRSVLCRLWLDVSCSTVAWHKSYCGGGGPGGARDSRDHRGDAIGVAGKASGNLQNMQQLSEQVGKFAVPTASSSMSPSQPRPAGAACAALDDGFIRTTYIKAIESVDSYDLDIEAIYRRHSVEEMSVPVICWTINFGCMLNDNEFLYFLAPQQIAHYWTVGLQKVVRCIQQMNRNADRRVLWLKKLYLQLYNECERDGTPPPSLVVGNVPTAATIPNELRRMGPRPVDALQAFGGRVEKWKNLGVNQSSHHASNHPRPTDSSSSTDGGGAKSRLKQMTIAVTRRVKGGGSRDCSRSQSPQPQSPLVRPPSIRSQLSSQSGPPGPNSPGYLLKPRGGGGGSSTNVIVSGPIISSGSGGGGGSTMGGFGSASFGGIVGCGTTTIGVASDVALSDAGDLDSLYTPRSRTPTSSSYGGRSVGGRSIKSWRSRGGETPNSGSISSSGQVSGLHGMSGKEYQEKPVTFTEFLELFRLFSTRMRKDLKDLFNDCVIHCSANSHVAPKRCGAADRDKTSPRLQSRLESLSGPSTGATVEFIPDDALTRNTAAHLCHLNEKQQKIYNALALASVSSAGGLMDTSRNSALSVAAIRQFFATQQMEHVDEAYVHRLIAEHEPDPLFRGKQLMSFEGFVRYLSDPSNFAFVPEQIEVAPEQLHYPLSYYYISCSHNTYLTGHQLKGESSAEMYRQVLQTGCRCVELDCWDGDDGLPLIYHGHTFTTKISFRQVVDIIKKSAFETSNLPVILSIENHCSLQQQAKMAQMFKTVFGEKLVTNFLFDCDYSDSPRLPTPWQLQNRILVKNKKMTVEPSAGLHYVDKLSTHGGDVTSPLYRKQSRSSYDSSTIDDVDEDDLDEFLDEEDPEETDEVDERTDAGNSPTKGIIPTIKRSSSSRRRSSKESTSECYIMDRSNTMVSAGGPPTTGANTTTATPKRVTNAAAMDELHSNPLDLKGCSTADDDAFVAARGGLSPQQQPLVGGSATTASSSGMGGSGSVRSGGGNVNPTASSGIGSASTMPAAAAAAAVFAITANSTPRRAAAAIGGRLPGHQIAPELSELVIYAQAVKFKGFVSHHFDASTNGGSGTTASSSTVPPPLDATELRTFSNSFATPKMRSHAPSLLSSGPPPRRQKSSGQISTTDSVKSGSAAAGGDDALTQQLSPGGTTTLASSGTTNSAASTVVAAAAAAVAANAAGGGGSGGCAQQQQAASGANSARAAPNASASCYQVSSLTEAAARKLCRKHPAKCVHYTRDHIMRTYPGGMRIDSSNFNPHRLVEFWQCGLQMVALNYQTPDVAMAVNTAMFEQSGNCGYMLKPRALWDQTHPLYGNLGALMVKDRVNGGAASGGGPLLGVGSALILQITIISGQYVCPGVFTASPFLEVELIGVPADCAKEKSKIIGRNSVNPIWNHSATFRINFVELAFLRLAVCDGAANGRVLSQRVVPVRCLRPGYRHLPLRSPANQPLEQATLFLRSRFEQEEHIYLHDDYMNNHHHLQYYPHAASAGYCGSSSGGGGTAFNYNNLNPATAMMTSSQEPELNYQILKLDPDANIKPLSILRRQIFIIRIVGLFPDETPTIVHVESASTVRSVIQTALINAGKVSENAEDYTLYEESATMLCSTQSPICSDSASVSGGNDRTADDAAAESPTTMMQRGGVTSPSAAVARLKSRELPHNEPIMDAVAAWNGSTRRFFLRKRSTDPTNRTWITSIIKSGGGGSSSSSTAATAAGSSVNLHAMSGAASTANAAASSSSALMSGGGSALPRRSYGGGGILHSAAAAPTTHHHFGNTGISTRSSADSTCTVATPKSHSSTQLHGRSLDVAETSGGIDYLDPTGIHPRAKSMGETFLVCIHNVSDTHPYAILRTSINNTSRDIIKQLFAKTQQRYDLNENHYVLIEELRDKVACVSEPTTTRHFGGKKVSVDSLSTTVSIPTRNKQTQRYRVLDPDENIWKTQSQWATPGRFLLERRDRLSRFENRYVNKLLQTPSDSNQSLIVVNPPSAQLATGITQQQASSASSGTVRDAPRKVSLSNVRSIGLSRRISRFGKSLTLDGGGRGKD